jgi:methylthioribose-1-phosphate isomerase
VVEDLATVDQMAAAISQMHLRGAGLIGAAGGYGMYLAASEAASSKDFESTLHAKTDQLMQTRPTAVNLSNAIHRQQAAIAKETSPEKKVHTAFETARLIAEEDARFCRQIGEHGLKIIQELAEKKRGRPINILTHCNAGWLAFVDYGTALSPVYTAHTHGIKVHVWVDETRPRNQGAMLTAWELGEHGVPHTVIADNAAGHLMQRGEVDLVLVGSDRTTAKGDVANKIGTYTKALAARDNNLPFYAALPSSSIDWTMHDGLKEIPIEKRNPDEVHFVQGWAEGEIKKVRLTPEKSPAQNDAFDVTPSRLVTGLITERGICEASEGGLFKLYPEKKETARR